jgi:hypothetical protein
MITSQSPDSGTRVFLCRAWLPATAERCGEWVPDNKPCASEREHSKLIKVTIGRAELALDPAHVAFRFFQQLMREALPQISPDYWLQLAEQYDAIAGVPPLPLIVSPRTYKLAPREARIAQACRQKAWVLQQYGPAEDVDEMITDVLQEIAA